MKQQFLPVFQFAVVPHHVSSSSSPSRNGKYDLSATLSPTFLPLLPLTPFRAARTAIGNQNVLHTQSLCAFFVGARVITCISSQQPRRSTQLAPIGFHRRPARSRQTGCAFLTRGLVCAATDGELSCFRVPQEANLRLEERSMGRPDESQQSQNDLQPLSARL